MENLQEKIWGRLYGSDLPGHMHFTPHFPSSLTGQLSASASPVGIHKDSHHGAGEILLSLLYGILALFLILSECLPSMFCSGFMTALNICESQMCGQVQNPFLSFALCLSQAGDGVRVLFILMCLFQGWMCV